MLHELESALVEVLVEVLVLRRCVGHLSQRTLAADTSARLISLMFLLLLSIISLILSFLPCVFCISFLLRSVFVLLYLVFSLL